MSGTPQRPASPRPARGDELELRVDSLAYGGSGVARSDGYVLFVQGAVPGDRVRAAVTKTKRDYGEARTLEVIEAGPDRVEPRAAHPGATWQVLRYEAQLREKEAQVRDALERIGRFEGPPVERPAREELRVALVDRLDLEGRLATREMQHVLALQRPNELLNPGAIGVDVHRLAA